MLKSPRIEPKPKVPALACRPVPFIGAQTGSTAREQSGPGYNDLYLYGHLTVPLVTFKDSPAVFYSSTE